MVAVCVGTLQVGGLLIQVNANANGKVRQTWVAFEWEEIYWIAEHQRQADQLQLFQLLE
jgi:hypothetical protein